MKYRYAISTEKGTREYNQDRAACLEGSDSVLLILGDGLGGHAGGDIAADILVDTASQAFLKVRTPVIEEPSLFLALILQHTHRAINRYAKKSTKKIDPRTTAVLSLIQDGYAYWAHAGDSRLYLFRNGSQLTRTLDHTGSDQAKVGGRGIPAKTGLYNCIGGPLRPKISLGPEIALQHGDRILICSDGVWQGMAIDEVSEYLYEENDLEDSMDNMLEKIEQRNPEICDNVTVVALAWDDKSRPGKSMQHEQIRDLTDNELWRAARDAEKGIRSNARAGIHAKKQGSRSKAYSNAGTAESLDSVINEVEQFVEQWEKGK
ncbi:MAG TPA: protein serine/threonine phosphatase 2C family protein [Gammaproteobacteria bacterium]|nr:protein serine/threonine phosphatase 2C family protein [Gammaproteobacteria bacterium]